MRPTRQWLLPLGLALMLASASPATALDLDFAQAASSCQKARVPATGIAEPPTLPEDQPITALVKSAELPVFRFTGAEGQIVRILADQSKLDVVLCLYDPEGRLVFALDTPFGTTKPEELMWRSDRAGEHVLTVGVSGRFFGEREVGITLSLLSTPTAHDRRRTDAIGRSALADEIRRSKAGDAQGLALFDAAIADWRQLGDRHRENTARLSRARLAASSEGKGLYAPFQALLPWLEQEREEGLLAWTLMEIAAESSRSDRHRESLYSRALGLYERLGSLREQAIAHYELGEIASERGEQQRATEHFTAAIQLAERWGDPTELANALYTRGRFLVSWSRYQDALADLFQSHGLRATEDRREVALVFEALGAAFLGLKEPRRALQFLDRALALHPNDEDGQRARGITLQTLGRAHQALRHEFEALGAFRQALRLYAQAANDLAVRRLRFTIAHAHLAFGSVEEARRLLERLLTENLRNEDPELWPAANFELAQLHQRQGRPEAARPFALAAIEGLETLPYRVSSLNLRTSYLAERQEFFELAIEVLLALDSRNPNRHDDTYRREALEVSDRSRSQALRELILDHGSAGGRKARQDELSAEIRSVRRQLQPRSPHRRSLEGRLAALLRNFDLLGSLLPLEASSFEPPTTRQLQASLSADTSLLHFRLANPRSHLWVVTHDSLGLHVLPSQSVIDGALDRAWRAIGDPSTPSTEAEKALEEASRLLFATLGPVPLTRRLIVVGNGRLQAFPLGALTAAADSAYRPLLADHEIVTVPSAAVLTALEGRSRANSSPRPGVLVVADPTYAKLSRLPHTQREAAALARFHGDRPLTQLLETRATRRAWFDADPSRFGLLHVATHGEFDLERPLMSHLDFAGEDGQDDPLFAYEIYDLTLAADLVVLSGCETGRGALVAGEGVLGLSHGFLAAGADRVLVTLWQVEDEPTARLFEDFYELLLRGGESPESALQQAQARMWQRRERFDRWAPFLLIGRPGG